MKNQIPFLQLTEKVLKNYHQVHQEYDVWGSFCDEWNGNILILFRGTYDEAVKVKEFIEELKMDKFYE